ncbi:MAG: TMEM165/GDT1 family protein [Candidatus Diapherotrites archaeon]|nr:TMEM165/GDT1 family protein [Candidatus Diapherotrites archaeon]
MLDAFLVSFALFLVSEATDKTQLLIFTLGLKFKKPVHVFFGALSAHTLIDGLTMALGSFLGHLLRAPWLKYAVGLAFIGIGVHHWMAKEEGDGKEFKHKNAFLYTFGTVALAEFGDKSQVISGLLAVHYEDFWSVFIGITFALALLIALNLTLEEHYAKKIPKKTVKWVSSALFILFGIASILA